jgi:hypothetical protein
MLRTRLSALVVAAILLSTSACVRISSTRLDHTAPAVPADSVKVFALLAPERYTELAILKAHRFLVSDSRVLNALKQRAARMGANGILLVNTKSAATQIHTGPAVILADGKPGVIVGNGTTKVDQFERAIAIRWTDESVRVVK